MKTRLVLVPLVLLGCSGAPQGGASQTAANTPVVAVESAPVSVATASTTVEIPSAMTKDLRVPFGGSKWGFVEASSVNGRFVFLRRFAGASPPSFGHHGEPMGDWPDLVAFDLQTGKERVIEEIIDIDADRRLFLVLDKTQVWLVDTKIGQWAEIDADLESDGNACLSPRQGSFSTDGHRLAWVQKGSQALAVRNLENGENWTIQAQGRLWRGWTDETGRGAILIEVPAGSTEWPRQNTSCACRWCNRFALSYGMYGWSGPAFKLQHVAEDGTRTDGEAPGGKRHWHGETTSGCKLEAQKTENGLDHGPWQWKCP